MPFNNDLTPEEKIQNLHLSGYALRLAILNDGRRALIIRTSDRIAFKQCRRKWAFSSHLKMNLAPNSLAAPLWFGSAIHYALEDFHGYHKFERAADAFKAYCIATAKNWKRELPPDAKEHWQLGMAMMDYYQDIWLVAADRPVDPTYWAPHPETGLSEPQVEVNFEIPIPIEPGSLLAQYCEEHKIDCVLYRGTFDRITEDYWGQLWVNEYKTAKVFQSTHFATDPQVTTYVWAAQQVYPDKVVAGCIYQQFLKKVPSPPPLLKSGGISSAANMVTSAPLYRDTLKKFYGPAEHIWPEANRQKLKLLEGSETEDRDRYVIRERINRNAQQCWSESQKILLELEDILNPDLPLYPNPTRDCARLCSFVTPCVNFDDGSDWEALLISDYSERDQYLDRTWRQRLPTPATLKAEMDLHQLNEDPDLDQLQIMSHEQWRAAQIAAGDYPAAEWEEANPDRNPFKGMDEYGTFNMNEVS